MENLNSHNYKNSNNLKEHPLDCYDCLSGKCELADDIDIPNNNDIEMFKDKQEKKENKISKLEKEIFSNKDNYILLNENTDNTALTNDVTSDFLSVFSKLKEYVNDEKLEINERFAKGIVNAKDFNLADTMNSSEIGHPIMDTHSNYKSVPTYKSLLESKSIKRLEELDTKTIVSIVDSLFIKEMQYISGDVSSAATIYNNVYFHSHKGEFPVDKSFLSIFLNAAKQLGYIKSYLAFNTSCIKEEDFIPNYKFLQQVNIKESFKLVESAVLSNISTAEKEGNNDELKNLKKLLLRLRYKQALLEVFNIFVS